ncbi:hypothetical protein [Salinilacihabitans rarus]|uniref:hypothetical protein n=1 Tax=Salinilacihabitans rarus TaxID=2961596 RepID=UPI0020C8E90F|nr:hypothetical protein [Salinilacihabitans rarus]
MGDSNDPATRPNRRSVLRAAGGALAGVAVATAPAPVAAADPSAHRRMARLAAENACGELDNGLCDYLDTVEEYADDPDDDPYHCPGWYPDRVCEVLDAVVRLREHGGTVDEKAATEAAAAKRRVDDGDYVEAAIETGRALHFVQDAGTLVNAGREVEQAVDYDVRTEYERWLDETWNENFADAADTGASEDVGSEDDVRNLTRTLADRTREAIEDRWHDVEDPSEYDDETVAAQRDRIRDAAAVSNGTVRWIWENA